MDLARDAMSALDGAFWGWLDVAPPQVVQNAYDVAEQIDVLASSLDSMSLTEAREGWAAIRSRLRI